MIPTLLVSIIDVHIHNPCGLHVVMFLKINKKAEFAQNGPARQRSCDKSQQW